MQLIIFAIGTILGSKTSTMINVLPFRPFRNSLALALFLGNPNTSTRTRHCPNSKRPATVLAKSKIKTVYKCPTPSTLFLGNVPVFSGPEHEQGPATVFGKAENRDGF